LKKKSNSLFIKETIFSLEHPTSQESLWNILEASWKLKKQLGKHGNQPFYKI